jgi:riboflavin biosynthesis pyrimidine reductase
MMLANGSRLACRESDEREQLCSNTAMDFEVLFDHAELSAIEHPAYARYGKLGFPELPSERPWIYSNFVQTLDGIASLRGKYASGFHISQSQEDRWLMDLLRAHADAILMGIGTLVEETEMATSRGPVFRIMDEQCRDLRRALGRGREKNIFVTAGRTLDLKAFRVFDGESVDPILVTTRAGEQRLQKSGVPPHVQVVIAGEELLVDLPLAMRLLHEQLGIRLLLCEGGPTLYGHMSRAALMDEKFVTVSPIEVGLRIPPEQEPTASEAANPPVYRPTVFDAPGFTKDTAPWWRWMSCRKVREHQFSRYRRVASSE